MYIDKVKSRKSYWFSLILKTEIVMIEITQNLFISEMIG